MLNLRVYREVKAWKKPLHVSRTQLARAYLKLLPQLEVIGITGSVGKTLTQNAIYSVLSQKFRTIAPDENLDPTFRIPKTILSTKPWHKKLVLEYGVEHPGDMDHYLAIAKPKIAVVTTISETHIRYFGSIEGVFREKAKLVSSLPKSAAAVLNADDPCCQRMAKMTQARVWWFGKKAKDGVKISHFEQDLRGSKFRLHYQGQKASVGWKVIGRHQLVSAYSAVTVGLICGLTLKQIARGLSSVKPPVHRLNLIVVKNLAILDDTYNSSLKAAHEAITTLLALGKNRPKIAVFGQMKDLGEISLGAHESLGKKIAKTGINFLITIGEIAKSVGNSCQKAGFRGKIINLSTTKEAIGQIKKIAKKNSLVLVKGSRHAHLERIVLGLVNKSTEIKCYRCGTLH